MQIYTKLMQYYRYCRNLQKYRKLSPKRRQYLSRDLQFYSQFIGKNDLCFDIGANIGDKTEIFVKLGARVVAVEPQDSCWRFLRRRFQNDNVKIVTKALGKTAGSKEIFIDRSHTLSSMSPQWIDSVKKSGRFSTHKWNYRIMVETTTLDELIKKYGAPDFCKIDVEGFEFEVIQSLSQPVNMVSFEFISEFIKPVLGCVHHLAKLGKYEFNYSLGESMEFGLPQWVDADCITAVLQSLTGNLDSQGDVYARFLG